MIPIRRVLLSSSWTPKLLPGLMSWHDISDARTVTKDGSNAVSVWADKSLNARNWVQATGASQPLWVDAQYKGLPTLRLDGSSDFMTTTTNWMNAIAAFTLFAVVQTNVVLANNCILTGSTGDRFQQTNSGSGLTQFNFLGGGTCGFPTINTAIHVRTIQFNGALAQALRCSGWLDGVAQSVTNSSLPATSGANASLILGKFTSSSAFWNGDICELIFYNVALTETQVSLVNNYLISKWL